MARAAGVYTMGVSVVTGTGVLRAYYGCAAGVLRVCCGRTTGVLREYYGCAVGILLASKPSSGQYNCNHKR